MKKLLLLTLVLLGGFSAAFATNGEIYLRNNITGWSTDDSKFKSEKTWDSTHSQDVYEFTINSSDLGNNDFKFRINRYDSNGQLIGPYNHTDYKYVFSNGQNETYTAPRIDKFQGDNGAFCIEHSKIKAEQYKITIYLKYNENVTVDATEYKGVWVYYIKAEIVSMPATVSALGYSTFSCDRALDLNKASAGLTAYSASVSDGKVVLTKVTGTVAAKTGLLLAGTTGTIPVVVSGTDISTTNLLKACVNGGTVTKSGTDDKYHYFLAGSTAENIGFYNLATDTECGAGKAYLETTSPLATEGTGGARASWVFQDEEQETDGIQTAKAVTYNDNVYYDLQGRKVAYPTKGLYIINGKKVVVK